MPTDPGPPADPGHSLGPPVDPGPSTSGRYLKRIPRESSKKDDKETTKSLSYMVRIYTNPKKKKDFVVRMWHDVSEEFYSLSALKLQLMDSFPEELPSSMDFQVGYFEGRSHAKRWLIENRDLDKMNSLYMAGSTINLWCEGKSPTGDCDHYDRAEQPPSKKPKMSKSDSTDELDTISSKLREKHSDMPAPKLRLWSKLIQSGRYDDYDTPPDIPLITGGPAPMKKKGNLVDALTGAATTVVKMLQSNANTVTVSSHTPPKTDSVRAGISPLKFAQLRRNCLEDLKRVKELWDDGVLTQEEFEEEKQHILNSKVCSDVYCLTVWSLFACQCAHYHLFLYRTEWLWVWT